jgi:UDP-GlcNAc:undecaprenyl-phosphate/decaprenyl-phosphate GlcNAc-1-phosphate transferase
MSHHPLFWATIVGAGSAAAMMPILKRLSLALGVTASRAYESAAVQVPSLGGPGIILGFALGAVVLGMLPLWLVVGPSFLCMAGVVDDATTLTPGQKTVAELIAALAIIGLGPSFSIFRIPPLDATISGLWLVGSANAFNLIDGLDGLAAGTGIIIAVAVCATATINNHIVLSVQAAALASALAGFLAFNFSPASIFMGDSGALPVGMLLGALALLAAQTLINSQVTRLAFPVILTAVPLLDTAMVIVSRVLAGHPVSRGKLDHAHDRLLKMGLSPRSTVMTCWAVEVFFAIGALLISLRGRDVRGLRVNP